MEICEELRYNSDAVRERQLVVVEVENGIFKRWIDKISFCYKIVLKRTKRRMQ